MKTKVKKFRFIAKIAQKIACLTACFAFSASAAPVAKVGETEYETLEMAIQAAEDGATISLVEGEYSTYGKVSKCEKRLTFVGAGAGKTIWTIGDLSKDVASADNGDYSFDGSPEITFKEMTLKADNANYRGFIRISKTVVEKCTLEGRTAFWGYDTASFVDSTFNAPEGDYALWDYSSKVMTFDGCQFITSGKAVNVYRDESLDEAIEVTLKDCTVNSTKDNKAVLNIKNANQAVSVTLAGENKVLIGGVETADRLYQVENAAPTATNGKSVTVVAVKADGTTEIVFDAKPIVTGVTVSGIAGFEGKSFESFAKAYAAIKPTVEKLGLGQEGATTEQFDALFTSVDANGDATVTYTISGNVIYDETGCENLLSMGRKASHYGNGRHLINFKFVGKTGRDADTLTVNSSLTLPYEWWGEKKVTGIHFKNLTLTGSAPSGLYAYQSYFEGIDFSVANCTLKGLKIYNCSNVPGSYSITDSVLDGTAAPANSYAIHLQGNETAPLAITISGNTITGYDRGINIDQKTAVATISGNTISVNDAGRSCVQLTQLAETTISGNKLNLTGGNAITLHENLLGLAAAPKISVTGNNIEGKGYLVYDGAAANGKAFTSDNLALSYGTDNTVAETVDTTKGVKGSTVVSTSADVNNVIQHYVAKIGEAGYPSLSEAIAAAKDGETVMLLADVTEDVTVATSVTLDLGGKTLTNAGAGKVTLTIAEGKTVTVKNGSIVGGASNYTIQNNGTATFEDVTATAGNVGSSMLDNAGTLTINSGNYSGGLNVVKSEEGSTLLITGGTFTLGYASGSGYTAVILVYGDTTITGGTFIQNATGKWINAQVVMTGVVDGYTSITRVKGGTFVNNATRATCKIFHGTGNATSDNFEVSGGTFNKSISDDFCAEGFIPKANGDGTFGVKEGVYVAAIGSTKYETLSAALAAAKAGKTVTLIADVTEDVTVATSVTLDLGGKTLTNAGAGKVTLTIAEGKTVTVKNGSIVGGASNYTIQNNGTATFEDVTATAGNVGSSMLDNFGTLTINSGTYVGGMNTVKNEPKATLTINGGTFENSYGENNAHTGVIYNLGHVAITGGELTQKATGPLWAGPHVVMTDWDGANKPSVTITGGMFTCDWTDWRASILSDAGGGTAGCTTVSGGTFNKKVPENYCAEGFIPATNGDGTFGVKEGAFVAAIGDVKYETLQAALAAAKDGETVKMLADALTVEATKTKVADRLKVNVNLTLDLNGHTLTTPFELETSDNWASFYIVGGSLTVKDSVGNGGIRSGDKDHLGTYLFHLNGGNLIVESGNFFGGCTIANVQAGTATIKDGRFEVCVSGGEDSRYLLNCIDASYKAGTAHVVVIGGTFVGYDPRNNAAEGPATNFVAPGVGVDADEDGVFTAKPNMCAQITDADGNSVTAHETLQAAFDAAKKGDTVTLLSDITLTEQVNITKALDGLTLDGNGKTITCATTDDPFKSGGSALYFGNASDKLYCTGIAIKNLTMTGKARFAIFLCGGTSTTFTNVKISGNYYIAVNLYGTHGATMTNCDISNSTTGTDCTTGKDEDAMYISAIWSNVASANPLTLNNTKVNVIAINAYTTANKLAPKIYVNADSTVAEIHTYDDGEFSGDTRLCVGASPVMPPVKIYDETDKTWIDAPAVVFVKALDEKGRVTLPDALLEKVAGATRFEKFTNLSKADANDNLAWVNLVAGIDSSKKVTMAAPQNGKADVIDVVLPAVDAAPAGTDVTVHYEIRAEGSDAAVVSATTAEDLVINLNGKAGIGTYRAYVCLLQNGTEVARVASENKLGVLQTVSAVKKTIIAVPWLSLTDDGNAIAVADLVKTAGLTVGDKLHVYNKAESRYDVYELAADRAWTPKAIYKVGADGTVEAVSSGTPETTTVTRGNGVWLERQDTAKAIVSYGQVASDTVATTIDVGTAEKPTWNLLAVPTTTAVDIAATFGASEADTLIVPTAGAPKICTVKDGAWGYEKSVPVTDESGNQLGVKVVREAVTELPAGTGFWYLNGGAANTVNW